jgi:hypothetical protein
VAAIAVDDLRPDDCGNRCTGTSRCPACRPCRRFLGRCALADRLWNCSVDKPSFILIELVRHALSRLLHSARSAAPRPRVFALGRDVHELAVGTDTPPSEPVMNSSGLPGTVTIACSSGWIASARFGSPSCVRS